MFSSQYNSQDFDFSAEEALPLHCAIVHSLGYQMILLLRSYDYKKSPFSDVLRITNRHASFLGCFIYRIFSLL